MDLVQRNQAARARREPPAAAFRPRARERHAVLEHLIFEKYSVVLTMNEHLLDRVVTGIGARFRSFKEARARRRYDDVARTLDALLEKLASNSESAAASLAPEKIRVRRSG